MAITPPTVTRAHSLWSCAFLFFSGSAFAATSPPAAESQLPFVVEAYALPNGLRLVAVPFDSPGIVAVYSLIEVGSRDEDRRGRTGFAHLFEHLMFRGTATWPKDRVRRLLMDAGAHQKGFTTDDFTCFTFVGSSRYLGSWLEYEADRLQRLTYSEIDLISEARVVLGEYTKSSAQVYLPLSERVRSATYQLHTYGHTTMGILPDIERMPDQYAYSRKFFRRYYTPDNTTLIVVGDFDRTGLAEAVRVYFGPWKGRTRPARIARERRQGRSIRTQVDFPASTLPRLSLSWRTPGTDFNSARTATYNILFELLFGQSSSLYRRLVLRGAIVADFQEWSWNHKDPYFFQVVATMNRQEDSKRVEAEVLGEVKRLRRQGPSPAELERIKERVRYQTLLELDSPDRVARMIAFTFGASGQVHGIAQRLAAIEKLQVKDVRRFARRYLRRRNQTVVTLVPRGGPS